MNVIIMGHDSNSTIQKLKGMQQEDGKIKGVRLEFCDDLSLLLEKLKSLT